MAQTSLDELDGLIQTIYTSESRYVFLSRVQYGSMWTVEIGTVGEPRPQWWRSVIDASDMPKSLSPERAVSAILEGQLHVSGIAGNSSPKLHFYSSQPDPSSIHLMSYSTEESALKAEKVLFDLATKAQKANCRLFGSTPKPPASAPGTIYHAREVSSAVLSLRPPVARKDTLPAEGEEKEAEIAMLKNQLLKSESSVRNLQEKVTESTLAQIGQSKRNQPALPKLPKDRSKGNPVHRKRVVEAVEFESDSDDDDDNTGKPSGSSKSGGTKVPLSPSKPKTKPKHAMGPPRKKRIVVDNDFESDND